MRFRSSYFENRQLTVVSTDSSCSGWLRVATADSRLSSADLRPTAELNNSGILNPMPPDNILTSC